MFTFLAEIPLNQAIQINETRTVGDTFTNLGDLIAVIVPNLFLFAGVIFLFLLILGGFSIISAESTKSVEEGQKKVVSAILGFVVMFSAYWIIQVVEFLTGISILNS